MFSDDVLEKIFARKELQSLDLSKQSSFKTIKEWTSGIKDSFINSNSDSIDSTVGKEVRAALLGIIDYDRLSEAIVSRLEKADITASSTGFWNSIQGNSKKWREEARRSQKNPVAIFNWCFPSFVVWFL